MSRIGSTAASALTCGFSLLAVLLLGGCAGTGGSSSSQEDPHPAPGAKMIITHPDQYKVVDAPWGQLTWYVSAPQGNCTTMTVGRCILKPGQENPRHFHPNCDEVLHVVRGTLLHLTEGGGHVKLAAGDTITIPTGVLHNAKNIGTEDAEVFIAFSSAHRKMIPR